MDLANPRLIYLTGILFLLTGRSARPIPSVIDHLTGDPNPHFDQDLAAMRAAVSVLRHRDASRSQRAPGVRAV